MFSWQLRQRDDSLRSMYHHLCDHAVRHHCVGPGVEAAGLALQVGVLFSLTHSVGTISLLLISPLLTSLLIICHYGRAASRREACKDGQQDNAMRDAKDDCEEHKDKHDRKWQPHLVTNNQVALAAEILAELALAAQRKPMAPLRS